MMQGPKTKAEQCRSLEAEQCHCIGVVFNFLMREQVQALQNKLRPPAKISRLISNQFQQHIFPTRSHCVRRNIITHRIKKIPPEKAAPWRSRTVVVSAGPSLGKSGSDEGVALPAEKRDEAEEGEILQTEMSSKSSPGSRLLLERSSIATEAGSMGGLMKPFVDPPRVSSEVTVHPPTVVHAADCQLTAVRKVGSCGNKRAGRNGSLLVLGIIHPQCQVAEDGKWVPFGVSRVFEQVCFRLFVLSASGGSST